MNDCYICGEPSEANYCTEPKLCDFCLAVVSRLERFIKYPKARNYILGKIKALAETEQIENEVKMLRDLGPEILN